MKTYHWACAETTELAKVSPDDRGIVRALNAEAALKLAVRAAIRSAPDAGQPYGMGVIVTHRGVEVEETEVTVADFF